MPATRKPGPGEVEICGLGVVRMSYDGPNPGEALIRLQQDASRLALQTLASRAEPRQRAAGLYYESRLAMRAADPEAAAPAANRLAAWAVDSSDPLVYALALQACRPVGPVPITGACNQLNVAQWARLAPTNAVPWLFLADDARQRGDGAAEAEAYYRASQATEFDSGWGVLPSLIYEGLTGKVPELARNLAGFDAFLLQAGYGMPPYVGLARFCSVAAASDANRRQVCASIAALQLRHGNFLDATVGAGIGERLTGSDARDGEARQQLKQLMQADTALTGDSTLALDCASAQRRRDRARLERAMGEVEAARQRVERGAHR